MESYIVLILAIVFELFVRLIPTKVNYSILDKIKEFALKLHSLIDIIFPNVEKKN